MLHSSVAVSQLWQTAGDQGALALRNGTFFLLHLRLSIADWVVRAHGGSINVESQVGQGSTFTVTLPLAASTPTPARSTAVETRSHRR